MIMRITHNSCQEHPAAQAPLLRTAQGCSIGGAVLHGGCEVEQLILALALPLGLKGGAVPFRTGDLSLMYAARLGRSVSFFL
eukprot:378516-Pelagomonas_calceolata.AAC.1